MSYADRKNKKLYERDFTMNKSQLVDVVAKNTGLKKKDAEAAVSAFVDNSCPSISPIIDNR